MMRRHFHAKANRDTRELGTVRLLAHPAGLLATAVLLAWLMMPTPGPESRPGHSEGRAFGRVEAVAWSPDGRSVASAGADGVARFLEVSGGRSRVAAVSKVSGFASLAFSPDGRKLALGTFDGRLIVVDLASRGRHREAKAIDPLGSVRAVAFAPDGCSVASAGDDRAVRIWDVETLQQRLVFRGHGSIVKGLAFRRGHDSVVSASVVGEILDWDPRTGEIIDRWDGRVGTLAALALSSDGRWCAMGGSEGLALRDLNTRRSEVYRLCHQSITALAFESSGGLLRSGGRWGNFQDFDLFIKSPSTGRTPAATSSPIHSLAASPDGQWVAWGDDEGLGLDSSKGER